MDKVRDLRRVADTGWWEAGREILLESLGYNRVTPILGKRKILSLEVRRIITSNTVLST